MPARIQRGHGLTRQGSGRRQPVRGSNPDRIPHSTDLWMLRIYSEITTINANLMSSSDPSVWPRELLPKMGIIKRLYQMIEQILLHPGIGDSCVRRIEWLGSLKTALNLPCPSNYNVHHWNCNWRKRPTIFIEAPHIILLGETDSKLNSHYVNCKQIVYRNMGL